MVCKGLCAKHRATRSRDGVRYALDQKRCQICQLFLWWSGTNCPCCGMRLRTRPKGTRERRALLTHLANPQMKGGVYARYELFG